MVFLPETLTWCSCLTLSQDAGSLLTLEFQFLFSLRLLLLPWLWPQVLAFSLLVEIIFLALELISYLSGLVPAGSPGPSNLLQSLFPSLALTFSNTTLELFSSSLFEVPELYSPSSL